MLEKTLESCLDSKEIKPVNPKGNQPWIFIGKTDAEAEAPTLWSPDVKSWFIGKDFDAGKEWGQEEKRVTGWNGWMASSTQWIWVWTNSRRWWRTGKPAILLPTGSQRVGHDLATEQQKRPGAYTLVEMKQKTAFSHIYHERDVHETYCFHCLESEHVFETVTMQYWCLRSNSHIYLFRLI